MEDSIRFIRGYDEIPSDDEETSSNHRLSPSPNNRRTIPIIITLTIFIIIIGTIILLTVSSQEQHHHSINDSETLRRHHRRRKPATPEQWFSVIHSVCEVTQHPDICIAEISALNSGGVVDPRMVFNTTLRMAMNEVINISVMSKAVILDDAGGLSTSLVLGECVSLFSDAVSQLSKAVGSVVVVMEGNEADLMTWIRAAKADLETCVEGLEEVGSMIGDVVKVRVQRASNSLAILANMEGLLDRSSI